MYTPYRIRKQTIRKQTPGDCSFPLTHSPPQVAACAAASADPAPAFAYTQSAASAGRSSPCQREGGISPSLWSRIQSSW